MRQMAQAIDLERIEVQPDSQDYPPTEIFQAEPAHTWCYYYQKIELARQQEDWPQVLDLWQQAQEGGHTPQHGYEYLGVVLAMMYETNWRRRSTSHRRLCTVVKRRFPYIVSYGHNRPPKWRHKRILCQPGRKCKAAYLVRLKVVENGQSNFLVKNRKESPWKT